MKEKISRVLSGCATSTRLRSVAAIWSLQKNPTVNVAPKSASLGEICIGSALDINPPLRWTRCEPDYRDSGIRSAAFPPMRRPLISRSPAVTGNLAHNLPIGLVTTDHSCLTRRSAVGMTLVQKDCIEPGAYYDSTRHLGRCSMGMMLSRCPTLDFASWMWGSGSNQLMCGGWCSIGAFHSFLNLNASVGVSFAEQ